MSVTERRLAIVGGGPRAVYALEALARQRTDGRAAPAAIDVYEPRAALGSGPAYATDQPDWIRLNIAGHLVDPGAVLGAEGVGRSALVDRLPRWPGGEEAPADDRYPSRARAGEYLERLGAASIAALCPSRVTHQRHEVRSLTQAEGKFRLVHSGGTATYDAVLLVTGHDRQWPGRLPDEVGGVPCLRALPVQTLTRRVAALRPARVVIRGASLTAIDAVLALTEGLGGSFAGADGARYSPGRPGVHITLASRTGRLMDVKPESRIVRAYGIQAAVEPALRSFAHHGDVAELVKSAATLILEATPGGHAAQQRSSADRRIEQALRRLGESPAPDDPRDRLAASLAQARGQAAPDASWALGQAWRSVYPTLVQHQRSLSVQNPAAPLGWADYRRLSPEFERLAFGPPPVNAQKLLAVMDAGRLRSLAVPPEGFASLAADADLVVDAVSAPPGVRDTDDPLWTGLLADRLVTIAPFGRGILVDHSAGCLRPDGTTVPGLSAAGRMTEDVVLGNDTLTRTLHDGLERWAHGVCAEQELVS